MKTTITIYENRLVLDCRCGADALPGLLVELIERHEEAGVAVIPCGMTKEPAVAEVRLVELPTIDQPARPAPKLRPMEKHAPVTRVPIKPEPAKVREKPTSPGDALRAVAKAYPGLGWVTAEHVLDLIQDHGWPHSGVAEPKVGLRGALGRAVKAGEWSKKQGKGRTVLYRPGRGRTR